MMLPVHVEIGERGFLDVLHVREVAELHVEVAHRQRVVRADAGRAERHEAVARLDEVQLERKEIADLLRPVDAGAELLLFVWPATARGSAAASA